MQVLIENEKQLGIVRSAYDKKAEDFRRKNRKWWEVVLETGKSIAIDVLIGMPKTFVKLAIASPAKIMQTYFSKLTFGKLAELIGNKGFINAARSGGESSSNQAMNRGLETVFSKKNTEQLAKKSDADAIKFTESATKYENSIAETRRILDSKGYGKDYDSALKKQDKLRKKSEYLLKASIGNTIEQYIGGNTFNTMLEKLVKRNTQYEQMLGDFGSESFSKINNWRDVADNVSYLFGFVGRSHGALKSISARYHFGVGFMARIEAALERGEDISDFNKLQEFAADAYTDWESGMYQQDNWITTKTNQFIDNLKNSDNRAARVVGNLASWDVAITKVPVNQMNEAIMELTLGLPTSIVKYSKEYINASKKVKAELGNPLTKEDKAHFKQALSEQLSKVDKKTAATIVRMFRHGGFGLGIMGLALATGYIKYGGHPHMGQKKEDEKKGDDELKTSEIEMGDTKLNEYISASLEHTTSMFPTLSYLSMKHQYEKDIEKGKSEFSSIGDATYKQLDYIISSYPQSKFINPLKAGQRAFETYSGAGKRAVSSYTFGIFDKK